MEAEKSTTSSGPEDVALRRLRLGTAIRAHRTASGHTSKEAAEAIGCSPQHYGDIENGSKPLATIPALLKLANLADLDRAWLLEAAWDARDELDFPVRLPPVGDDRRERLLRLAHDIYSDDVPPLP